MNVTRGLNLARRVTEAAPDFSRGWSARAGFAGTAARDRLAGDPQALRAEAAEAAQQAIRLDPGNSEAYQKMTYLLPRRAYAQREALHIKSVSVRPSDCGCEHVAYGSFLSGVGRNDEALGSFKRAHDMIPQTASANTGLAQALLVADREEEARAVVAPFLELWPEDSAMAEVLVRTALWTGRYVERSRP
jgi:tetratricopeptide (TPR) repeat protein